LGNVHHVKHISGGASRFNLNFLQTSLIKFNWGSFVIILENATGITSTVDFQDTEMFGSKQGFTATVADGTKVAFVGLVLDGKLVGDLGLFDQNLL
jgi:hypothetical protein